LVGLPSWPPRQGATSKEDNHARQNCTDASVKRNLVDQVTKVESFTQDQEAGGAKEPPMHKSQEKALQILETSGRNTKPGVRRGDMVSTRSQGYIAERGSP